MDKVKVLSLNIISSNWVCLGFNGVYALATIIDHLGVSKLSVMPYILTFVFAICLYFFVASAMAFQHCYKDFKLQYPKLT